jgi:RimJ/RimL family protein N-acetyltransferase
MDGDLVTLRAIERDDIPTLLGWDQLWDTFPEISDQPYVPKSLEEVLKAYDGDEESSYRPGDSYVPFAIVVGEDLVGSCCLWGVDLHNRRTHLGIGLGPEFRGKGYGTDAVRVILRYAFEHRGLHRVQLEVLTDNLAAVRTYEKTGFVEDGRMRESAWVRGAFVDEIYMSVLSTD